MSKLTIWGALLLALVTLARGAHAQAPAKTVNVDLGAGVTLDLVLVPAGSFTEGSPATEAGRNADESPRTVTLTSPFYIGKSPVTKRQFARFVDETRFRTEAEIGQSGGFGWDGTKLVQKKEYTWKNPGFAQTDQDPVTIVTWGDAEAFVRWLATRSGRTVSLPTEAQWEYAARAGTKTPWWGASDEKGALALGWFLENAGNGTHPVGQKPANAWGLVDVAGNVWEWCSDWYGPYGSAPAFDPIVAGAPAGETPRHVLRGGSWLKSVKDARSAARYRNTPGSRNADNGFRVVASVEVVATPTPAVPLPPPTYAPPPPYTPPPPSPPPPPPATGMGSAMLLAPLFGCGSIGAIIALGVWLARRRSGASGGVSTDAAQDGFWLRGALPAGATVRYECWANGVRLSDTVPFDPGPRGTFVYTGAPPTNIRILQVTYPNEPYGGGGGYRGGTPSAPRRGGGSSWGMTPAIVPMYEPPPRRYPPAY